MLGRLGLSVETAANGEQTIGRFKAARARGEPSDLVILDLTVPGGIGGKEVVRRLQAIDAGLKASFPAAIRRIR